MKISDKTNTMLHASAVFIFTANNQLFNPFMEEAAHTTKLWMKHRTECNFVLHLLFFRRQSAIILCFEETFILVSFFKHSCCEYKEWKYRRKPSHCSPLHPASGREALSGAVQRWTQRPEHGPLITVIAAAVIIWSPPVQAPCLHHSSQTLYFIYSLYPTQCCSRSDEWRHT